MTTFQSNTDRDSENQSRKVFIALKLWLNKTLERRMSEFYKATLHAERMRRFRITIFSSANRNMIEQEREVSAVNTFEARKPFLERGIEAHRIYCLDITK